MSLRNKIIFKRLTAAEWTSQNPLLAEGEPGFESDTGKMKIGDGSTRWTSLAYQASLVINDDAEESENSTYSVDKILELLGTVSGGTGVDGGSANSTYLVAQNIDGGNA